MNARILRILLPPIVGFAMLASSPATTIGFSPLGPVWAPPLVPYRVNPVNFDLPVESTEAAVRAGADVWATQTNTSLRFTFAGRSVQTTVTNDAINLVLFRQDPNTGNPNAIATTYTWSSGGRIIDSDIVFWDGAFHFFTGATGCSSGFFIEDIAAHEFGHALGLGHTTTAGATMFPSVYFCSTEPRSLHADDMAGVLGLYPPSVAPPTAPTGLIFR